MPNYGLTNQDASMFTINWRALFGDKNAKKIQQEANDAWAYKPSTTMQQDTNGAYFKGRSGLTADAREAWEKKYLNEINGLSESDKDEVFRNTLFSDYFKNSTNPEDQKVWESRSKLTSKDRDILYATRALGNDLDGISDVKESSFSLMQAALDPSGSYTINTAKAKGTETLRDQAQNFLAKEAMGAEQQFARQIDAMSTKDRENLAENFDKMSEEMFPIYREYEGTDKLVLTPEDRLRLAAKYSAWESIGGSQFAYRMLNKEYQDTIAKNQSIWEKSVNTVAQFADSGAGMIIRAAGMLGAAVGIGKTDDESYLDNILDNSVTRYGDRLATTQSWSTARQKYLEENGLQDNAILNTTAQQNAMLSWNTPFEVIGQYGFTAASTLLSLGGSSIVEGITNGAGWLAKSALGTKALTDTAKGVQIAKGLIRAKDIGNFLVVGGISTVEGAMNAVGTRDKALRDANADIDSRVQQEVDRQIDMYVDGNPQEARKLLAKAGYKIPKDAELDEETLAKMKEGLKQDPGVRESFAKQLEESFYAERQQAEDAAHGAMVVDFIGNSIINGFINSTFQSTLNAPSVQRTLRKYGLQKSPIDELGVGIVKGKDNTWKAVAKKFTKWEAVKNRFSEAWGEGIEEYTQDISGAFGEGYAKDRMSQYLDYKYGDSDGTDAFEEDLARSITAGLIYAGDAAVDPQSIKDGLYGILSTAVGGPNANINNRGSKERAEGESGFERFSRRSLITWRSALGPLFNGEVAQVNKQRDETAARINEFFSDPEKQNLFFDMAASTNWMRDARRAMLSGDEKALRDARVGEMVANIFALGELQGSAYHDAITESLKARTQFDSKNLNDENSTESKAVEQYLSDVRSRGENVSKEEALETIKKSATDMLSMMDAVEKETASVEKLFGAEIDKDTKESLVYHRISTNDTKKRMGQLDEELDKVKTALAQKDGESSGLSRRSRRVIAQYGSIAEAEKALAETQDEKELMEQYIPLLEDEVSTSKVMASTVRGDREARRRAKDAVTNKREQLRSAKEYVKQLERDIQTAKRDIAKYRSEQHTETETYKDEEGNDVTVTRAVGNVLSAAEIMSLASVDRAKMLNPENEHLYSEAQKAEIQKVKIEGSKVVDDFASKVRDRGRLESSYEGMNRLMLRMTQDPSTFARYQANVKAEKQDRLLFKKYQYLSEYDGRRSYEEFARELSRIFSEEPDADKRAAIKVLRSVNSEYFDRFSETENTLGNIISKLGSNEAYNKLSDNDKNLFVHTLEYLVNNGIDVEDTGAVVEALSDVETQVEDPETGQPTTMVTNPFADYVSKANGSLTDADKGHIESIGQTIQNFKDVMSSLRQEAAEQAANSRTVEVTSTTPEQSAPPQAPTPQPAPSVFASTHSSPDGGHPEGSDNVDTTPQPVPTPQNPQGPQSPQGGANAATVEAYRKGSNDLVAKAADTALTTAENTPSNVGDSKAIEGAKKRIEALKDNFFETVEDFHTALLKEANELDQTGEEDKQAVARVLRRAADTAKNQAAIKPSTVRPVAQAPQAQLSGLAATKFNFASQFSAAVNPNSSTVSTLNIQSIKKNHPDGALAKFLNKYKVEEFLSDPNALTGDRRTVRFIVDSQLAEETKASMESAGDQYTVDAIPIVPVVEVQEKSDHVIVVNDNGTERYYQPIGVLPATYNTYTSGANRLGKLRSLAASQEPNQLIKDENGNVVSTPVIGHVSATAPAHLAENQSVLKAGANDLTVEEQNEMKGKTKDDARKTAAYKKMRDKFLSHLVVGVGSNGSPELHYSVSNLKNDGSSPWFLITKTPVHRTVDSHSKTLVIDLFRNGQVAEALEANSRLRRFSSELQKALNGTTLSGSLFAPDGRGGYTITKEGQKALANLASTLESKLSNFMLLPGGMKYSITPVFTTDASGISQIAKDSSGNPLFTLSAGNGTFSIPMTTFSSGTVNEQNAFEAIKNLLLDENNQPRMRSAKEGFMVWQVPYPDVKSMDSNSKAKENIEDVYDDGILEVSKERFDYTVKGVSFNAPFTMEGRPTYVTQTVGNSDNANSGTDTNVVTGADGSTIDPVSGATIEGGSQEAKKPLSPAARTAADIVEQSKHIKLSEDGSTYVDDRTGQVYARVTSVISADREAGERFDPNSPWALPSTNIGTGIDELVRDFFAGTMKDYDSYPNTTKEAVEAFVEQLKALQTKLTAEGLTVVPRDVVVTGSLDVTDAESKVSKINVAGTLDLMAYDADGNFYIFDMKTFHTSIDDHKKQKYARQLSLYKKFLEDTYGITVKSMKIIPIKVNYPNPTRVKYALAAEIPNQLISNGIEFTGAAPNLHALIPLNYTEPHIEFEKLTDAEKAMISNASEAQGGEPIETVSSVTTSAPTGTPVDPLTGMGMPGYQNPLIPKGQGPMAGQAKAFVVSDLRWGVWTGLTDAQKELVEKMLPEMDPSYNKDTWDSNDPDERPSDAEKEHAIKCILGIK